MIISYINQPIDGVDHRTGDHLNILLRQIPPFKRLLMAVAFVKESGLRQLADSLRAFRGAGGTIEAVVGVDMRGSSVQGLELLRQLCDRVIVLRNRNARRPVFHPKLYFFEGPERAVALVGSTNLTLGGLYINYEQSVHLDMDLGQAEDRRLYERLIEVYGSLAKARGGITRELDEDLFRQLIDTNQLFDEESQPRPVEPEGEGQADSSEEAGQQAEEPFGSVEVPGPPAPRRSVSAPAAVAAAKPMQAQSRRNFFVVSVLEGDLPQPGSSNEIRITKGIRDKNPEFWGWPNSFEGPDHATGQYHRRIRVRFGREVVDAYLKDFPGHKPDGTKASADFRIGSIAPIVQDLSEEDDLLVLTKTERDADFEAAVIHKANLDEHERWAEGLIQHVKARSTKTGTYKKYKYSG